MPTRFSASGKAFVASQAAAPPVSRLRPPGDADSLDGGVLIFGGGGLELHVLIGKVLSSVCWSLSAQLLEKFSSTPQDEFLTGTFHFHPFNKHFRAFIRHFLAYNQHLHFLPALFDSYQALPPLQQALSNFHQALSYSQPAPSLSSGTFRFLSGTSTPSSGTSRNPA